MVFEVFVDVECVEEFCVEFGEEYVNDDGNVDFFFVFVG